MMPIKIEALLIGHIQPLGHEGAVSAIDKKPVFHTVKVTKTGIIGDEQADLRFHGGTEKAIHHYPRDFYKVWQKELPSSTIDFKQPGAFGENISTFGLTETDICIGDIWRVGTTLLEVSQARQPCWKLNPRFNVPDMARRVQETKRTGWYYRILEEGDITPGDTIHLEARPCPHWSLARLLHYLYEDTLNTEAAKEIITLTKLAESWRKVFIKRLETNTVENWEHRLMGMNQP